MQNVIIISDYAYVEGGAAWVAIETAIRAKRLGCEVTFICGGSKISQDLIENDIEVISINELGLNDLPMHIGLFKNIWNQDVYNKIAKILQRVDKFNSVIHIHSWTKVITSSGLAAVADSGIPVIFTLHDYFYACPNGGFYDFNSRELCNREALSLDCISTNCDSRNYPVKIWRSVRQLVQNKTFRERFEKIGYIFVSEYSEKIIKPYIGKNSVTKVIENPKKYTVEERVECEKNNSYISVGRIALEKGLDVAANAIKGSGMTWEVAGEGREKAKLLEICPEAKVLGWLDNNELYRLYDRSRAMIFPSMIRETQGLSVSEALSFGIPVIVSSEIAAAEYIEHCTNGLVFNRGDPDSLKSVLEMTKDDKFIRFLSENAYKMSRNSNKVDYINSVMEIYDEILDK